MRATGEQLAVVQKQVSRGEYEVNSQRVAVAILERIGVIQSRDPVKERGNGRCPPARTERPPGSLNRTAGPGSTRPTSVRAIPVSATAAAQSASRARGTAQSSS